jgi:hypothetical protein
MVGAQVFRAQEEQVLVLVFQQVPMASRNLQAQGLFLQEKEQLAMAAALADHQNHMKVHFHTVHIDHSTIQP